MKDFFKITAAAALGTLLVGMFMGVMSFIMFIVMIAVGAGSSAPSVSDGSVLRISLQGTIEEQAGDNTLAELFGGNDVFQKQGLNTIVKAINVAKENKKIKGIYLEGGALTADYPQVKEISAALQDFKKSGKFVYAYADQYTTSAYAIASTAGKVALNPSGAVAMQGFGTQVIFFTDLLKKVGVKMQVFKVGTFKSAVEPFILTEMSDANREQVQSFLNDSWNTVRTMIAKNRNINADSLNAYVDRYLAFADAKDIQKMKLVDTLTYIDGVRDNLRQLAGVKKLNFVSPSELVKLDKTSSSSNHIAVYYAEGNIVDISSANPLTGGEAKEIVGSKVVDDLDKLANDDDVKAVVLRINSGGGSAYASEQMWRAIQLLKAKKPVVVSMGGMAASGGYYMSCGANKIVADPTTLTGSIGIFGMVPDVSGLATEKLGLHFDVVKTNAPADLGTMGRPFNAQEGAALQANVERGYRLFLQRVADGRGMKPADVDKIAQGRVWTGRQALGIKLVDQLGTLADAVKEAAKLAKVEKDYLVVETPTPAPWYENMLKDQKDEYLEQEMRAKLGILYEPAVFVGSLKQQNQLQARMPFFIQLM